MPRSSEPNPSASAGPIRNANLRATESGSPPAAWIQDTPPRRTLPILNHSPGGIPGKRGEESQEIGRASCRKREQSECRDRAEGRKSNETPSRVQTERMG